MKIINVMASSLDGYIGLSEKEDDASRIEAGLSNEDDQNFLKDQLRQADAVVVGANSIRSNGVCAELAEAGRLEPSWYIYSDRGLDAALPFWKQASVPRTLVSSNAHLPIHDQAVGFLHYAEGQATQALLLHMKRQGHRIVLLFGGSAINRAFYNENAVDELKLTLSPTLVAMSRAPKLISPELPSPISLRLLASQARGNFVFLHYAINRKRTG